MTNWYISDLHLGHKFVAELRGFSNVEDHDRAVLDSLKPVTSGDALWVLGDVTCTSNKELLVEKLDALRRHPGRKHLISGNHDQTHPMHREAHKWIPLFATTFDSVQAFARFRIPGTDAGVPRRNVLMSHLPYSGDSLVDDRYEQYRLRDLGLPLIHGHTHQPEQISQSAEGTRQINVCWEAWKRPVRQEEIIGLVDV